MKLLTATIIIGLAVGYGYGAFAAWRYGRNMRKRSATAVRQGSAG